MENKQKLNLIVPLLFNNHAVKEKKIILGFSKLSKEEKIKAISEGCSQPELFKETLESFQHKKPEVQQVFDELIENTITNFYFPFGIAPNFVINNKVYHIPMVIEESSVVAAASKSAKFWMDKGGFKFNIINIEKIGQVHFTWKGDKNKLYAVMPELEARFRMRTTEITKKMESRGGGILKFELRDKTADMEDYYQIKVTFNTVDSMGANFINSCLEEFALELKDFLYIDERFIGEEKQVDIIMSILSNYTPNCIVQCYVETHVDNFQDVTEEMTAREFVKRFEKAVNIARVDTFRATTHNKGIFNGIDAVALATGNDFRAIEAAGHTYASRDGKYRSLTKVSIKDDIFRYEINVPLSIGTVGGLTSLHPMAKLSLNILGNPDAEELMGIIVSVGLANNFAAIKSLVTSGIQKGHMKMHLVNILNKNKATADEKKEAKKYFETRKVSVSAVEHFLSLLREHKKVL